MLMLLGELSFVAIGLIGAVSVALFSFFASSFFPSVLLIMIVTGSPSHPFFGIVVPSIVCFSSLIASFSPNLSILTLSSFQRILRS